jgi:hypothetical protein
VEVGEMNGRRLKMFNCEECEYYRLPGDAPADSDNKVCMLLLSYDELDECPFIDD